VYEYSILQLKSNDGVQCAKSYMTANYGKKFTRFCNLTIDMQFPVLIIDVETTLSFSIVHKFQKCQN